MASSPPMESSLARRAKSKARALGIVVGLTLGSFMIAAVLSTSVLDRPGLTQSPTGRIIISAIFYQFFGLGVFGLIYLKLSGRLSSLSIGSISRQTVTLSLKGLFALYGVMVLFSIIIWQLDLTSSESTLVQSSKISYYVVAITISVLIIAPAEEFFFRGVIQQRLQEQFHPILSILIASLIFAVPHFGSLVAGSWQSAAVSISLIFILGTILGRIYQSTGHLLVPILIHAIFNTLQYASRLFELVM